MCEASQLVIFAIPLVLLAFAGGIALVAWATSKL